MRKRLILFASTIVSVVLPHAAYAECPGTEALRAQLVAQNTANISRVIDGKNCALIPSVLAFNARANAMLNQAMIRADCTPSAPGMSVAALGAMLRKSCGGSKSEAARTANQSESAPKPKPVAKRLAKGVDSASPEPIPQRKNAESSGSGNCSTITGPGADAPTGPCKQNSGAGAPKTPAQVASTSAPAVQKIPEKKPEPGPKVLDSGAAIESLRDLLPELGKVIDDVDHRVNSAALPPPDQWRKPDVPSQPVTSSSTAPKSLDLPGPDHAPVPDAPKEDREASVAPASEEKSAEPAIADSDEDKDYAAICQTDSVKTGLKSLKQDVAEAVKSEGGLNLNYLRKKLKMQWQTLKECARDPLEKAFIQKLEKDPLILDPE